ncbi:hypothetical protein [Thorsellia anophelis]|uniref:Uncharacterized protein n=1 Tax=Thorsellia anophelis DSM 18579 TaxID=1123402 RepID=A0A1I0DHH9_9GAMM|nr:hypothetical protein [Thorsellia anophelis]SET31764.1 hypothetical protein SAMN02583745_01991 [Thorsellia anophelis DSM 18579]
MEGTLIFCQDGVLRLQADFDDKEAIPLAFIQKFAHAENDDLFMFDYLNHIVRCEEGVTLANIMFAIEPWKKFLSKMLGIDLESYLTEIRKPTEIENDLDWISVSTITILAKPDNVVNPSIVESVGAMLSNLEGLAKGFFMDSSTRAHGYIKDDPNAYAIDCNIQSLKNLPVYIDDFHYLLDYQNEESKSHLFNQRYSGVKKHAINGNYIEIVQSCKLKTFLEGLFKKGLYYPTPEISALENAKLDAISESLNDIDYEQNLPAKNNLTVVGDNNKPETEVVNMTDRMIENLMQQDELSDVLESFLEYFDERQNEWDSLTEACHQDDDYQIRIGQIKFAKAPQRILLDAILPEE